MFLLHEILQSTDGELLNKTAEEFSQIGTDTRKALTGQLFIALRGENFDAHNFLPQAVAAGAAGLLVDKWNKGMLTTPVTVIKVRDTLKALQNLAHYWRRKQPAQIVALTGSNGKTTSKEFLAAVLAQKFRVHWSQGSFNNHWGVPMSLLGIRPEHQCAVIEMGMNHLGEIKTLCDIATPDIVGVTMVGRAHIGELGSQENICRAKFEIYENSPKAKKIFNLDNEHTLKMYEDLRSLHPQEKFWTFSAFSRDADVSLRIVEMKLAGLRIQGHIQGVEGQAQVHVFGRHNGTNLMFAAAMALAMGVEPKKIWDGFNTLRGSWGRNQLVSLQNGTEVLFDGYNANPDSVAALIRNTYETDVHGRKFIVLGEMLELGALTAASHREIGELVGRAEFDIVWFMGPSAPHFEAGIKSTGFTKTLFVTNTYEEKVASEIGAMLKPGDVAVVKGSRGVKIERVIMAWNPVNFESKL